VSRLYDFQIEAELPEGVDHVAVGKALRDYDSEFTTPDWWEKGRLLSAGGNISVCGGRHPDEVIDEIAKAMWSAAGCCFEVKVSFVDLEDLPYETEVRDRDDFDRLVIEPAAAVADVQPPKKNKRRSRPQ